MRVGTCGRSLRDDNPHGSAARPAEEQPQTSHQYQCADAPQRPPQRIRGDFGLRIVTVEAQLFEQCGFVIHVADNLPGTPLQPQEL